MLTKHTYAAIEHNSGMIWGVAIAATPELACSMIHREAAGPSPAVEYERVDPIRDSGGGYHLYAVPADLTIDDGTDQAAIDALTRNACDYVGDFRRVRTDEEA